MLIDSHCHVDQFSNPEQLVAECEKFKIRVVAVTNMPSHFEMAVPHLESSQYVFPALGLHPLNAREAVGELDRFQRLAKRTSLIGEIGLDFSRVGVGTRDLQERIFNAALDSIQGTRCLISLHSRGAEKEVLNSLKEHAITGAIFHWYSGSIEVLEEIVEAGHFVSFNPSMTRSKKGLAMLDALPISCLLAETDGPYSKFKGKPCHPKDVAVVYSAVSEKFDLAMSETETILEENFLKAGGPLK